MRFHHLAMIVSEDSDEDMLIALIKDRKEALANGDHAQRYTADLLMSKIERLAELEEEPTND